VRFPAPVRAGRRLRGHFRLLGYTPIDGGAQLVVEVTMEIEGEAKPACVAESVSRRFVATTASGGERHEGAAGR
jgi:acyl dehydratase